MPTATSGTDTAAEAKSIPPGLSGRFGAFLGKFTVILGAQRELWLTFSIKLFGSMAYKLVNTTLVLWLSSDLGFNDQNASFLFGAFGIAITGGTLLVGSLTDAIGLRKTFFLGISTCVIARSFMALSTSRYLTLIAGLLPLAFGEALGNPVLIAAVGRYSSTRQRSIAFSISYAAMNGGFYLAVALFDYLRNAHVLGEHGHLQIFGGQFSTYRCLLLVALLIEICLLPIVFFIRAGAEATDQGLKINPEPSRYPGQALWRSFCLTAWDGVRDTVQLFKSLFGQTGFYRLLGFLLLIGFLKILFMQLDAVFPKFGIRVLGEGAPVGLLTGNNYLLIIFLAPLVGALTQRFSAYSMVILGSIISAASVFIMAMPTAWFEPLANSPPIQWIGHSYLRLNGPVHPYYAMTILYILLLSIGEAFYSPRVYEYAAAIAPKGQEASYGALSYVPLLLGKVFVGAYGGILLAKYCPETGPRNSGMMWLMFALATSIAPVGLIIFRRYIRVHEVGRQD